jgi:dinuclear metal center YbgI/SA1388 family protein
MPPLSAIVDELDNMLDPGAFEDHGPNGLQVPGCEAITTVATGVSAGLELFQRAAAAGAELVLVHHGLFWEGQPRTVSRELAARLKLLLAHEINLVAYHLPLDAHPEFGNNALIAAGLRAEAREPFGMHRGRTIGFAARFAGDGLAASELFERVRELTGREPLVFEGGPARVRSLGIISGGAAGDLQQAIDAGLDAFLTGEPAEPAMALAREAGVHFIAAGHYATETFGVRRLGELVAQRFDLAHEFIDVPNPV